MILNMNTGYYFVSPNGLDEGNNFSSIQKAINQASLDGFGTSFPNIAYISISPSDQDYTGDGVDNIITMTNAVFLIGNTPLSDSSGVNIKAQLNITNVSSNFNRGIIKYIILIQPTSQPLITFNSSINTPLGYLILNKCCVLSGVTNNTESPFQITGSTASFTLEKSCINYSGSQPVVTLIDGASFIGQDLDLFCNYFLLNTGTTSSDQNIYTADNVWSPTKGITLFDSPMIYARFNNPSAFNKHFRINLETLYSDSTFTSSIRGFIIDSGITDLILETINCYFALVSNAGNDTLRFDIPNTANVKVMISNVVAPGTISSTSTGNFLSFTLG